jgi:CBS-domain-containing membrane protein
VLAGSSGRIDSVNGAGRGDPDRIDAFDFSGVITAHASMVAFGALATGLAMFLMVVTKTEHPPAAALALGLVLNEWTLLTLVVVIVGVIALSICKQLVLPILMDLL